MLRKKRLKCGRIPVRLFLACHQKSNTFKCKQFCCAKPMCACLFMGCAPRPRERRAAAHSPRLSFSCSAHSPASAPELERVRASASCFASRSALSKHSRLSPLERALCSLFFANIASLHPPPAALRSECCRFRHSRIFFNALTSTHIIYHSDLRLSRVFRKFLHISG